MAHRGQGPGGATDRSSPPRARERLRGTDRSGRADAGATLTRSIASLEVSRIELTLVVSPWVRCGQVFGLVSASATAARLPPTASQSRRTSARRGFRSHLPLRGSPGFSPGSLFALTRWSGHQHEHQHIGVHSFSQHNIQGSPITSDNLSSIRMSSSERLADGPRGRSGSLSARSHLSPARRPRALVGARSRGPISV